MVEKYSLSGFNIDDEHCKDDQKPAAFSTKATIPPEDGKNDDDIAVDNRKPVAKSPEEMLTSAVQEEMVTNTNLYSLAIGGKVVP